MERILVETCTIPVRWSDMDALGHVNNSRYLTYFEQARIIWIEKLGYSVFASNHEGPTLLSASCTYYKPIYYPAELIIKLYIGEPGNSSFMMYYEMSLASDPEALYSEGACKTVWMDYQANKSKPMPDIIRNLFA